MGATGAAIPDVVDVARGQKTADETKEENASLHKTLKQQEDRIKILQNKNAELISESEELNRVRVKVDRLRNGKKAFGEKIKNLEREKELMLKQLRRSARRMRTLLSS